MVKAISKDLREKVVRRYKILGDHKEVSLELGVSIRSIYKWVKMEANGEDLTPKKRIDKPRKVDYESLKLAIENHPNATQKELGMLFGMSGWGVGKALRRIGIVLKKTLSYKEADKEKQTIFLERIKDIPKEQLVYVDESGINQALHKEYGYAKRGVKIHDTVCGMRFVRENFIAAKVEKRVVAPMCYQGNCDTEMFNFWLENFLIPELKPGQIIIMDNAAFHKSEKTKNLIKNAKCELLFLPPY